MSETRQLVKWELKIPGIETSLSGRCDLFAPKTDRPPDEQISALGLADKVAKAFPKTHPLYYSLFIESPLNRDQAEILLTIVSELATLPRTYDYGHTEFQTALRLSLKADLEIYVEYTPPGHVDFDTYTIHCHCPRCKARTPTPRWKGPFPEELTKCNICGFSYSPAATRSRRRSFSYSTVACAECHRSVSVDRFSDKDKKRINCYVSYRELEAELRMIHLVQDLLHRYPFIETALKQRDSGGFDKLFSELPVNLSDDREQTIVKYLEKHSFNAAKRGEFVAKMLQERTPHLDDQVVFCPECHGAMF